MALETYRAKRDFAQTPEPSGDVVRPGEPGLAFVVQRHDASRLHYDLRLEWNGVLWSWAVPKGPSLDPADRRLAVRTEDHPVEYLEFEGVIPAGAYGAGTMVVWDRGGWKLVKMGGKAADDGGGDDWLLIKADDSTARPSETPATPKPALDRPLPGPGPSRPAPLEQPDPPFVDPPTGAAARGVHWVAPELVAEITFTERTRDGLLRHPSFQGLGDEPMTPPTRSTSETRRSPGRPIEIRGVRLSSPDKVLYPDQGVTKRDLALYYDAVADWCLPHVAGRPLSLVRCPAGREKHCFYQKHAGDGFPGEVARIEIEEKDGEMAEYLIADSAEALVALVQMGTLELHVWGSRRDRIERPDRCVLDLDPGEGVQWGAVVDAARDLRDRLAELGLDSFVKTTGGKGLHVVAPLTRVAEFDAVKAFSKLVAQDAVRRRPERYVANMAKAKRSGKIFVDYLRNGRGATFVAPYSTRARPGAPVSVPLTWEELSTRRRSDHYTVANTPRRLTHLERDPWEGIDDVRQQITRAMWTELGGKPPGD